MSTGFVRAGKYAELNESKESLIEQGGNPKFGFYWWYWFPSLNYNGGSFFKKQCVDIGLRWLCYSAWLIFYYVSPKNLTQIDDKKS